MGLKGLTLERLAHAVVQTVTRFPVPVFSCVAIAVIQIIVIDNFDVRDDKYHLIQWTLAASLLLPLSLALRLVTETRGWKKSFAVPAQLACAVVAFGYFFTFPSEVSEPVFVRHAIIAIVAISLLSWLPFSHQSAQNGYWQFNKTVVLRCLGAVLVAGTMFVGIAIAIAACNQLFNLDIRGERYGQLWVMLSCFVAPMYVLAGIPTPLASLQNETDYPKPVRAFAQYLLLPLVGLYLVILYLYEIKIVSQWNWPQGWVSLLIFWYAAVGLAAMLILWPLRKSDDHLWVRKYSSWFFYLFLPLLVLLVLAIKVRVADYGFTVNRFLGLSGACLLTAMCLYYILSKTKDIRAIPIVIALVGLLTAYGPLSAWSFGERDQLGRLQPLLTIQRSADFSTLDAKEKLQIRSDMSSIVEYLVRWHGMESMRGIVPDSTLATYDGKLANEHIEDLCFALGFEYASHFNIEKGNGRFSLTSSLDSPMYLDSNTYFFSCDLFAARIGGEIRDSLDQGMSRRRRAHGDDTCYVFIDTSGQRLYAEYTSSRFRGRDTIIIELAQELQSRELVGEIRRVSNDSTRFFGEGKFATLQLQATEISGEFKNGALHVTRVSGDFVIKGKD